MCGAGLSRRACGAVGDGVTVQGRALESCVPGAAAAHAGLAAVAIHAVALIWELARMDFLTVRGLIHAPASTNGSFPP